MPTTRSLYGILIRIFSTTTHFRTFMCKDALGEINTNSYDCHDFPFQRNVS